jgi:hypothetical protein
MGWNRKQQEKKLRQPLRGERDWTREQKDQIKEYLRRYGSRNNGGEQRKAG